MENNQENQMEIDNEIIINNMNNISQYIKSTNEDSDYFNKFNEQLYRNYNEWFDDMKIKIQKGIKNSEKNIQIYDLNYDNNLISLIKKVSEPHNYKNNKENLNNNNEIFEKVEELTNFNDIIGVVNTCSVKKRNSLLAKIHNNENNNNNINENINDNTKLSLQNDFKIEKNNDYDEEDINSPEFNNISNQKEKISYINLNSYEQNEQEEENSLCTIVEQPSNEELEKNTISQKSKFYNTNLCSSSNNINKIECQNNNNNINNNYILNINNNKNTLIDKNSQINKDKTIKIEPLKLIKSNETPQKNYNSQLSENLNNNYFLSNSNNKVTHENLFYSNQKSPYFGGIKNDYSSSQKYNTQTKNHPKEDSNSLFSFSNTNQKNLNNNEFIFSTNKKVDNNISNNKKEYTIFNHTITKKEEGNNVSTNNSNTKNFINVITNSINNNINQNIFNSNIKIKNNINNNNDYKSNDLFPNNYVQNIVLTTTKKAKNLNNNTIHIKIKQKYEDDFEEYEMSDSSLKEEENEGLKFIPKWAQDKEYLYNKIMEQNKDKTLIEKSFGKFVVEQLNLNMILETHDKKFEIRNSTADWRDEESFAKNKVTNINDKEMDLMFPNRKLEF